MDCPRTTGITYYKENSRNANHHQGLVRRGLWNGKVVVGRQHISVVPTSFLVCRIGLPKAEIDRLQEACSV